MIRSSMNIRGLYFVFSTSIYQTTVLFSRYKVLLAFASAKTSHVTKNALYTGSDR